MKFSQLFTKTTKNTPAEEVSKNAVLLERAGFAMKSSAGVYIYLPMGFRVAEKIKNIVRKHMNNTGSQEIAMPALLDPKYLKATGRDTVDVGFEAVDSETHQSQYILSWTHEEVVSYIAKHFISSYRDLPRSVYQFQTKFRNERRAKSGLLRGREFVMKDMYSFHADEADFWKYYEEVKKAYLAVFNECGLDAYVTLAGGGDFTLNETHEFQVITEVGEDTITYCENCKKAWNIEVTQLKAGDTCEVCGGVLKQASAVEVCNIFPLDTKYSKPFSLNYLDDAGQNKSVIMGSYGIGIGRLMGVIVETHNDARGIIWPESVAPFDCHLIVLDDPSGNAMLQAEALYQKLRNQGKDVLFDDRAGVSAGEKFADADLIGIPQRILVSARSLEQNSVEIKSRSSQESTLVNIDQIA